MPQIYQLPLISDASSGDQIPVYQPQNGDARRMSLNTLFHFFQQQISANNIDFLQAGFGAQERTIQNKLRDVVSVKDFGAIGNGIADDTMAIQTAINAAASIGLGARVYFPTGQYKISSEITISNTKIVLCGDGIDSTIIRQITPTANGINFNYPISFGQPTGGGLENLTIEAGAGFSSGGLYGIGSTGDGVRVKNASDNFSVQNVSCHNFGCLYRLIHCWNTRWTSFRGLYGDTALRLELDGSNIGAGNSFTSAKLSNLGFTGNAANSVGIQVKASGGEWFWGIDVTSFGRGVVVDPSAGSEQVLYLHFVTVLADTSVSHNWDIDGTNGKNVWSIRMAQCWGSYSTNGAGLRVRGANVNSVRWLGGSLRENGTHGAIIENDAINVSLDSVEIASNGKLSSGIYHGVNIGVNVDQWQVSNSRIGNFASGFTTQQDGIFISSGNSENFVIVGNDLTGNLGVSIALGTSSDNFICSSNLPIQADPNNRSISQSLTGSTPSTVAAGTTVYLGPAGAQTYSQDSCFVANKPGVVSTIYAASQFAPGAGETYTYTLVKNGIDTSMVCVTSGASSFSSQTSINDVSYNSTDTLELKLVTSAGAAVGKHRFFITAQ